MATDHELREAALAFLEQSDNAQPDTLEQTVFGPRGYGYYFEFDEHFQRTMVNEWAPLVGQDGNIVQRRTGDYIETFIGGIAASCGINTNDDEINEVVEIIKLHLPHIEG